MKAMDNDLPDRQQCVSRDSTPSTPRLAPVVRPNLPISTGARRKRDPRVHAGTVTLPLHKGGSDVLAQRRYFYEVCGLG